MPSASAMREIWSSKSMDCAFAPNSRAVAKERSTREQVPFILAISRLYYRLSRP